MESKPEVYTSQDELEARLVELLAHRTKVIGLDGIDGSGKSRLSTLLSASLELRHIQVDDYHSKKSPEYVVNIDCDSLRHDVLELGKSASVIVDGVCLGDVVSKCGIQLDLVIYNKRLTPLKIWSDGDNLFDYSRSPEEIVRDQQETQDQFMGILDGIEGLEEEELGPVRVMRPLTDEIMRYHHRLKPNLDCDIIFENVHDA